MNETKILEFTRANPPAEDDLEKIGEYLMRTFSEFMGQKISCFQKRLVIGEAIILNIRNDEGAEGPFAIQWDGVLMYSVRESEPAIDAELFLFSHGERLGTLEEEGNATLVLTFVPAENNGIWKFYTWHGDEYDEWTYIKEPRRELYEKFKRTYG